MRIICRFAVAAGKHVWLVPAAGGVLAAAAYVFAPLPRTVTPVIYVGSTALAAVFVFRGAWRAGTAQARSTFLLVGAAMASAALGSGIYQTAIVRGHYPAPGSLSDVFWLAFYPLLLVALLRLINHQDGSWLGVLDVGVLAATGLVLVLAFFVEPYLGSNGSDKVVVVQSLYAVFDVLVLAALVRLALTGDGSTDRRLFLLSFVAYLSSDFSWNWLAHLGSYTPGSWGDCGWILAGALLAAAALHPASQPWSEVVPERKPRHRRTMLLPLATGLAVFPLLVLLPGDHAESTVPVALAALGLVALVTARLWLLLRENTRSRQAEQRLTDQLQQAQKMESVGQLSAGIAHDFNNLLMVILGYSDLLRARLAMTNVEPEGLDEIVAAAERARDLTQQLLAFGRRQTLQPAIVSIDGVLRTTVAMLRPLIAEDIKIAVVVDPDAGRITVDPGQLEHVLTNLIINARDAMPAGGSIELRATPARVDGERAAVAEVEPGPYVAVSLTDTGTGMDEETRRQVFEPFFTTKAFGTSSGLGLSMTYGIIRQSAGFIEVTSTPDVGSTFTLYLPATTDPPLPATAARSGPHDLNRRSRQAA